MIVDEVKDCSYFAGKYRILCDTTENSNNLSGIESLANELKSVNPTIAFFGRNIYLVADDFQAIENLKKTFDYYKQSNPKRVFMTWKNYSFTIDFNS